MELSSVKFASVTLNPICNNSLLVARVYRIQVRAFNSSSKTFFISRTIYWNFIPFWKKND